MRLFNVSIHINLYPNRLKYDGNRRKKAKILESRSPGIPECLWNKEITFLITPIKKIKYLCIIWLWNTCLTKSLSFILFSWERSEPDSSSSLFLFLTWSKQKRFYNKGLKGVTSLTKNDFWFLQNSHSKNNLSTVYNTMV